MNNKTQKLTIFFFCGWILMLSIGLVVVQARDFSPQENRYLSQFPSFSMDALFSGDYTTKVEEYVIDQFPQRDLFVQFKAGLIFAAGQLENKGVYFGKEGYLIPKFLVVDEEEIQNNIQKMIQFQAEYTDINFSWMIVPTVATVAQDSLPDAAVNIDQIKILDSIEQKVKQWVSLSSLNQSDYFYKTDHHWNTAGAQVAYQAYMNSISVESKIFSTELVSDNFKGTSSSLSGAYWYSEDSIYKIEQDQIQSTVTFEDGTQYASLYFPNWLSQKDQYSYYLDGNHALTYIENVGVQEDLGTLLILKDSFAHSLVPYLSAHYSHIILLDLRYYNSDVSTFLVDHKVDRILYLYGLDTLSDEKNFVFLK